MTTLTRLSMYPDPRPHMSNEERLQILRRVWPVQCGNNYFRFNGGGSVGSRHASISGAIGCGGQEPAVIETDTNRCRRSALPASTLYGANAQVDGRACESEMGFLASHQKPEIDTGHPTLSRSQSVCNNSLPVGGLVPFYDDNPPSAEEVAEAAAFEFGLEQETS